MPLEYLVEVQHGVLIPHRDPYDLAGGADGSAILLRHHPEALGREELLVTTAHDAEDPLPIIDAAAREFLAVLSSKVFSFLEEKKYDTARHGGREGGAISETPLLWVVVALARFAAAALTFAVFPYGPAIAAAQDTGFPPKVE